MALGAKKVAFAAHFGRCASDGSMGLGRLWKMSLSMWPITVFVRGIIHGLSDIAGNNWDFGRN